MNKTKNIFLLTFMLLAYTNYAQIININNPADVESSYNLQQLVVDVLINSDCAQIDNFSEQVFGQPTNMLTKSYGYFKKPVGSDFPFEDGIILTTGQAYPAGNLVNNSFAFPNFANGLPGDADLEAALGQTNTNDATFIKFNFTPTSNDFNFRFLMASEEYDGSTECTYADSFAFLLREVGTTTYINLAVLPDGTPVSVKNINDAADCRANTEYFAGYNLGSTNYGGRTKVLTANAVVVPNQAYEMKIVVADQGDSAYDSAIFLEAGSFNLGLDLGEDQTQNTGNPACDSEAFILNTQVPTTEATHTWYKDGVEILGESNQTLDVIASGEYSVVLEYASNCTATDAITIEFINSPTANIVENQFICDNNNDGFYTYDFQIFNEIVLGTQNAADVTISYHLSQADADNNINAITNPYTNLIAYQPETIFIRVEDNIYTYCYDISTFDIAVFNALTVANPLPLHTCELDNDGFDSFDITLAESEILNGLPVANYTFSYYENENNAILGNTEQIISPTNFNNTVADLQTVYVRVQPVTNQCFQVIPIRLIVNSPEEIAINNRYVICLAADDSVIPAVSETAFETPPIDTQLNETDYVFQWYEGEEVLAANSIPGANQATYNATAIGYYTVHITNSITGCTNFKTTEVIASYPPESISAELLTNAFSENSTIQVAVTGVGTYEYSIYEGLWQSSPIFENVLGGSHIVKVRDLLNCEELTYELTVIDYPKFFTPNNDGHHDTWNIQGLRNQLDAKIYIYDRYGKLIKQLGPTDIGWNGTFNGRKMPASDYWFTVEFIDSLDGVKKEFISHFTLKR